MKKSIKIDMTYRELIVALLRHDIHSIDEKVNFEMVKDILTGLCTACGRRLACKNCPSNYCNSCNNCSHDRSA